MTGRLKPFTDSDFTIDSKSVNTGMELGRGNFSRVYRGTFEGRQVAVKRQEIVDSDLERYLLNELAVLRQMKHEGCIKFYGAYKTPGDVPVVHILTEYLEGGDLRRLLQDKGTPLGWKFRSRIALGCARALAYMHSMEILHRDIKTENCLLSADGTPKLCDFGFARAWDKTKTMTMCGTDEFMAPEIIFGMQYDEKVDVFSFGIVLAELITRKIPGKRDNFLNRSPKDGFAVDADEIDRETKAVNAPQSIVLLTKDCTHPEAESRLSASDVVAWLDDMIKELNNDKDAVPNLNAEAIKDKLQQYLAQGEAEEKLGENNDDDDDDGSNVKKTKGGSVRGAPKTEEAKRRTEAAIKQSDMASNRFGDSSAISSRKPASVSGATSPGGGLFAMCFSSSSSGGKSNRPSSPGKSLEMSGWVTKRGGRIKTWKRRWMVITETGIVYFKSPEDQHVGIDEQGSISFEEMTPIAGVVATAYPTVMTNKPNSFGVHTEGRTYYVAAANPDERGRWIRAISDGHRAWMDRKGKRKVMSVAKSRPVASSSGA